MAGNDQKYVMMEKHEKSILDVCCGSRMFWFDKHHPDVLFSDIRELDEELCDGRMLNINPDIIADFRNLPFDDGSFKLVVFDPPHLEKLGKSSWMAKKYGVLSLDWRNDLRQGFSECFRVLKEDGILIFKWNESQIKISEILKLTEHKPLLGHTTGRQAKTKWVCFMKITKNK